MKNTKTRIGDYKIKVPELVVKIGLVYDSYKHGLRAKLWSEAIKEYAKRSQPFDPGPLFHEEKIVDEKGKLTYEFRYYSPPENIEKVTV